MEIKKNSLSYHLTLFIITYLMMSETWLHVTLSVFNSVSSLDHFSILTTEHSTRAVLTESSSHHNLALAQIFTIAASHIRFGVHLPHDTLGAEVVIITYKSSQVRHRNLT